MNNKITAQLKQWREDRGITKPIGHPNLQTALESEIDEYTEAVRAGDEHGKIDALTDLGVLILNELALEGYVAELTFKEVIKTISSRKQDPEQAARDWSNEKWNKWLEQPEDTLYKENFSHCKIKS